MTVKSTSISVAEILRRFALSILPAATLLALNAANAQDATNIPRPNIGWSPGAVCADDYALTFINGQLRCVDSVARAGQATTATTAGTAQQLDPNATVSASQISGSLTAQQIQTPTCGSGEVLTNTGGGLTCVAAASSGGPAEPQCPAQNAVFSALYAGWPFGYTHTHPLGTGVVGQVQVISGAFTESNDNYEAPQYHPYNGIQFICESSGAWKSPTSQPIYDGNILNGGGGTRITWTPGP